MDARRKHRGLVHAAAPKPGPAPRRPRRPTLSANSDLFEIEAILAERAATATSGTFFLVKWKDCPEARNEWVPLRDLGEARNECCTLLLPTMATVHLLSRPLARLPPTELWDTELRGTWTAALRKTGLRLLRALAAWERTPTAARRH